MFLKIAFATLTFTLGTGCKPRSASELSSEEESFYFKGDPNTVSSVYSDTNDILREKLFGKGVVTYANLKPRIKKFKSVLEMIEYFTTQDDLRPFLDRWALLYNSESLFEDAISYHHPRIILRKGPLFIGIVQDPDYPDAFKTVEFIEFQADASFKFHRLVYSNAGGKFTDNDPVCADCHGESDPRPIWAEYALWPGAYGEKR